MWPITIFLIICCFLMGICSITNLVSSKKETDEQKKKNQKRAGWFFMVITLGFACYIIFTVIPQTIDFEPVHITSSNQKEKCAMCGKMVSEDDMRGKWCKDCQNDAFGEDGWYDKIKD